MSNIKKDLMNEIEKKVKKHQLLKKRAQERNTVEAFVINFIDNVDDINQVVSSQIEWEFSVNNALNNLRMQVMSLDRQAKVNVNWLKPEDAKALPRVNNVVITWSKMYQTLNGNCEPTLSLDSTSLLFK